MVGQVQLAFFIKFGLKDAICGAGVVVILMKCRVVVIQSGTIRVQTGQSCHGIAIHDFALSSQSCCGRVLQWRRDFGRITWDINETSVM